MPTVYRSVRIVLQNSTDDVFTVEGAEVIQGEWSPKLAVKNGERLEPQSARAFGSESTILQRGAEGFVRIGSVGGYLSLHWARPWVGDFRLDVSQSHSRWQVQTQVNEEDPAAVSVLAIVSPSAPLEK
ncbi:MAG: hypothetical protein IRZ16_20050 [Myxococcaceae bacterium]|nr:hypothetical protein [Myxococcaceae bacterium]